MHSFLWSGKDRDGKERAVRVEAENAQQARAILTAEGWTELRLIRDEVSDAVKGRNRAESIIKPPEFTPDQELERYLGKRPGFITRWWKSLRAHSLNIILLVLTLAFGIYAHETWSIFHGSAGLLLIILLFPFLRLFYSQSKRNYARLNRAKVHGRWNEVLECVEKLRNSARSTKIGVPEVELARNRAIALAHLGRLETAVDEFKRLESSTTTPAWLYASHLGGIYIAGGQYEKALECQLRVVAEKPDMSAGWVDLAGLLAHRINRPAQARQALARAEKLELVPNSRPHILLHHGVILWREGKLSEAKLKLEQSLVEFKPFAKKPLVERSILRTKSYLCAVNRSLGNRSEADQLFREVKEFLKAHREEELLQACGGDLVAKP